MNEDIFQNRYIEHQDRKKRTLEIDDGEECFINYDIINFLDIVYSRRSQRIFNNKEIGEIELNTLIDSIVDAPSSCNRQAISVKILNDLSEMDLLVGGFGWAKKAKIAMLLFANMDAYKSPNEREFMPYLDAGFVGQNLYLTAEAMGLGACFINPNIREENKERFGELYNKENLKFCGAMVFGHYDKKAPRPPKRNRNEAIIHTGNNNI